MNTVFFLFPIVIEVVQRTAQVGGSMTQFQKHGVIAAGGCYSDCKYTHLSVPMQHARPTRRAAIKKTLQRLFNVFFGKPVGKATQMTGGWGRNKGEVPGQYELTAFQ